MRSRVRGGSGRFNGRRSHDPPAPPPLLAHRASADGGDMTWFRYQLASGRTVLIPTSWPHHPMLYVMWKERIVTWRSPGEPGHTVIMSDGTERESI